MDKAASIAAAMSDQIERPKSPDDLVVVEKKDFEDEEEEAKQVPATKAG